MRQIAHALFFGKPVIFYFGIFTITSIFITAVIGYLNFKGIRKIPFRWLVFFAVLTMILALLHGLMGVLTYL